MGQKIKPRLYRLGVDYDNSTLLITFDNRIPVKDRNGHKSFLGMTKHKGEYGKGLGMVRILSKHREEIMRYRGLLTNRIQVQVLNGLIRVKREVYQPVNPDKNTRKTEYSQIRTINNQVNLPKVQLGLDRIVKRYETTYNREVQVELVDRNSKLEGESIHYLIETMCRKGTKLRELLVSQEGRGGALVLNARMPCAERLSKVVSIQLEDSRKHTDVISQRRDMYAVIDKSQRGRVDYATIITGSLDSRQGGYRGYRIVTKGTIDGGRRTRKEVLSNGVRPLSTITSPISYAYKQAKTKTGTRGVHVMYCY